MGLLVFLGSILIAYGPLLALFIFVVRHSPRFLILSIGSAFFFTLSILISSIIWFIIPPLRTLHVWGLIWSILIQELFRIFYFKVYEKAEIGPFGISPANSQFHLDHFKAALSFGWGSAISYVSIQVAPVIWESLGPGNFFLKDSQCENISLFPILGLYAFCFSIYHILWSIISFNGYKTHNRWKMGAVIISHYLASFLTLFNLEGGNCYLGLIFSFILLAIVSFWTFIIVIKYKESKANFPSLFAKLV